MFFIGNLKLLDDRIRIVAERAMRATEKNNNLFLLVCLAYTSTEEIVHASEESCKELWNEIQDMAVAPDVNFLVRTSGEYRLSNFLLWQMGNGFLYSTKALWPEMGLGHLV